MRLNIDRSKVRGLKRHTNPFMKQKLKFNTCTTRIQDILSTQEGRQRILYPTWENNDSGKIFIRQTDKFPYVRIDIINQDFPGVIVCDIDKLIQVLENTKEKFKEK